MCIRPSDTLLALLMCILGGGVYPWVIPETSMIKKRAGGPESTRNLLTFLERLPYQAFGTGKIRLRGGAGLAPDGHALAGGGYKTSYQALDARAHDAGLDGPLSNHLDGGRVWQRSEKGAEEASGGTVRSVDGRGGGGRGEGGGEKEKGALAKASSESARLQSFHTFPPQSMFPLSAERLAAAGEHSVGKSVCLSFHHFRLLPAKQVCSLPHTQITLLMRVHC